MVKRLLILLFMVTAGTLLASANTDPRIVISEPACQEGDTVVGPEQLTSGFALSTINGGGTFHFCNQTGVDWTSLIIAIRTTVPASTIDCPSASPTDPLNNAHLAFSTCQIFPTGPEPGVFYASFFGTRAPNPFFPGDNGFLGVPNTERFTIDLDCHEFLGCDPWPNDSVFVGVPNNLAIPHVPEPASAALVGTALVAGFFRRKLQR
jgi:hypothetical protein